MRGLLKALPSRASASSGTAGIARADGARFRIAYLFAGTYGDFVQALRPLNRLAAAYPDAEILLHGADRYAREFAIELPRNLRIAQHLEPVRWLSDPVDLLFTNCVGVYRVRFDFAARFGARRAFGFRHSHESHRGGYAATVPLLPEVRSFAEENLKVLDLAGVPAGFSGVPARGRATIEESGDGLPPWGKGKILFHIGSAGLKKDFGLRLYTRLVMGILNKLDGRPVEVVMGPGDEDIALEVRTGTGFVPQMFPLPRLIRILRSFEGTVLCFNSFPAHICHYLGRSAIVMHREAVPYGYDCGPLHRQVILSEGSGWDLSEIWDALRPEDGQSAA
ncbi:MAG: hypothetical protein JWP91_2447 [Fibrobacteres bacterium]|nr:hypothetical protein [Fibrobacterota bacterium]